MEWVQEDLVRMIQEVEQESIALDYKACDSLENTEAKKNEISKDVSAFANSAGGVIVYGIREVNHIATELDAGFDPTTITKEWLEDVIQGRIHPRIHDVHINPIQLTTHSPGKVAYAVTIPPSNTAHQAHDKRYYKRFNFKSEPMEHHEIRDVMARSRHPLIEPVFSFQEIKSPLKPTLFLHIVLRNVGAMRARDIKLVVSILLGMFSAEHSQFIGGRKEIGEQIYDTFSLQKTDLTIFPDDEFSLTHAYGPLTSTNRISTMDIYLSPLYDLRWKVYADDMPPKEGRILLKDIPV